MAGKGAAGLPIMRWLCWRAEQSAERLRPVYGALGRPDRPKLVRSGAAHGPAPQPEVLRIWMKRRCSLRATGKRRNMRCMSRAVRNNMDRRDLQQFETVCQIYYRSVFWPGIELKRRRWEEVEKSRGPG